MKQNYGKKILSLLLCVVLCIPTAINYTSETLVAEAAEKGGPNGYTPIYTIDDLAGINNNPSGNYILMNDIDMTEETKRGGSWDTGHGWTPLDEFSGKFIGNGYRIIGMNIYGDAGEYVGLFSEISGGYVEGLGMENATIDCNGRYCGSIAGNIHSYKSIGFDTDDDGENDEYDYRTIWGCYTSGGNIKSNEKYAYVGGLIGLSYSSSSYIYGCYNTATVDGNGIFGCQEYSYGGSCCNYCYNVGQVTNYQIGDSSNNSYGLMNKSPSSEGCTIRTEAQMRSQNTYTGFGFERMWIIDPYSNYPYPQLRCNLHSRVTKMEVANLPNKVEYRQSESLELAGGTVTLYYEDGRETTVAMEKEMLTKYDMDTLGTQDVILSWGGASCSFAIDVKGVAVSDIELTAVSEMVSKGGKLQIQANVIPTDATNKSLTWSSNYPEIASVDENGCVTGVKVGAAEITATAINGVSKVFTVIVTEPCISISFSKSSISLNMGEEKKLEVTKSPIDSGDILNWTSSDSKIASVEDGKVKAVGVGKTKIKVSASKNVYDTCTVKVYDNLSNCQIKKIPDKKYTGYLLESDIVVTNSKGNKLKKGTDYTVSYSDNLEAGTANVTVNGKGYYKGTSSTTFIINKSLVGRTDKPYGSGRKRKGKKYSLTLNWNKKKYADGYELRYSTKASMSPAKSKFVSAKTGSTEKYVLKGLKTSKTYYIQVRAYRNTLDSSTKDYGKWSKTLKYSF